tara:strand:- start:3961 stop:5223 length:1263 start_codon:yes stop_codon:yes gene_type:complete
MINFKKKRLVLKKKCVLCDSRNLKQAINFGKTPLANSYPKTFKQKENFFGLSCVLCDDCGHLQLKELINPKILFENYLYVSGTSKVLSSHFKRYSQKVIKKFKLNKDSNILDIACNDGTFLENFVKKNFRNVIGVEPAKNLRNLNLKKNIDINSSFFSFKFSHELKKKYGKFELITANNVFAHSPHLYDFCQGVKNILSPKGVFVIEVSYLNTVIRKKTFDTIYHEHMSYHSLKPLVSFFKRQQLQVFDFELIEAQGGSIRVYVSHSNSYRIKKTKIKNQIKRETNNGLFLISRYKKFFNEILNTKNILKKLIKKQNKKKYQIIGYGAPAKLTTFSHFFDLTKDDFKVVIDDNNLKVNRYSPGKKFLIKNFSYLSKNKDKYQIIIVLAWNFYESIKKKCTKLNKNFNFINPFPKPKLEKK